MASYLKNSKNNLKISTQGITQLLLFCGLIATAPLPSAIPGEIHDLKWRDDSEVFWKKSSDSQKTDSIQQGSLVKMQFRPEQLAAQTQFSFPGVKTVKISKRFLYLQRTGYDAESGRLGFSLVIYEEIGPDDRYMIMGFDAEIKAGSDTASDIACAIEDCSLQLIFEGRISAAPVQPVVDGTTSKYYPAWTDAAITVMSGNDKIISGSVFTSPALALDASYLPIEKNKKLVVETVLDMEAEDMNGLVYYSDWERDEPGWYARELYTQPSGNAVAVVHGRNMGAVAEHRLETPLKPGTYRVALNPHKGSSRWDDNIIEVTLGDATNRIIYMECTRGYDEFTCEPFHLSKTVDVISLKAVQCGMGGVNTVPEMPEPILMLDRIRIDRIEWQEISLFD